ncbi:hypothetical protein L2744_00065 [Shewanella profunda]|uniref:hypothetical protein n=1 Tax=Shewanella profunda TaxID=254793 RepID=UPI00200F2C65|nr:hypothetical protein [Shewanella profunda]MCL1088026.1 hypothetical protein [Shewanella profunda]
MSLDMEDFTLDMIIAQAKAAQLKKEANTEKLPALFDKTLDALVSACEKLEAITAERDQLAAYVERFNKTMADLSVDADDSDDDPIPCSLWELFEVTPKQCLNHVRAKAVMNFAELPRDVYLSGTVTAELTVYDVYQLARYHLKANYGYDTQPWDDDDATTARNALNELSAKAIESIDPVNFVSIALRHTTVSGDFDYQDIKDAFNFLAAEHRQAANGGE